ncbi:META domain-containing protein [Marinobacterium sedimentorum]|uniref:META domain-containing protein n=1 Tax=Marinobacterium sedimentorum TaxID=2927804 RepID=UPI0020C6759B|nr:META domain-containing protein [Marinobacterium sedimentorum]MCP8688198.1 META domain-containing protein [Marinobacterium sedimentorum]
MLNSVTVRSFCLAVVMALGAGCAQHSGMMEEGLMQEGVATDPGSAQGTSWQWLSKTTPREMLEVAQPERYTLALQPDGRVQAQFDCNRGHGSYEISDGRLTIGPVATTMMVCLPGSLDAVYGQALEKVESFRVENGELLLGLEDEGGTLRFRAAP